MRADFLEIAGDGYCNFFLLARFQIEKVERAKLFVNDRARAGRCRLDVESVIRNHFLHFLALRLIGEQRNRAVAVGKEINRVADPQGIKVVGIFAGNLGFNAGIRKLGKPNGLGLAPSVALPGRLPLVDRHIGQLGSAGRVGAFRGARQGELGREAALGRHGVEARVARGEAGARRAEQNRAPVRRPAHHYVGAGMIRQLARHATLRRNYVDIRIAGVVSRKGHPAAVRRKLRIGFNSNARGEAFRLAAPAVHRPEIPRKTKNDLRLADRRTAQQQRLARLSRSHT